MGLWGYGIEKNQPIKSNREKETYKINPLLNEAHKLLDDGELDQALAACNKAILGDSTNEKCYLLRAKIKTLLSKDSDAITDYTKALQLNPRQYQAYLNRGLLCLSVKKTAAACFDFTKAMRINPVKTVSFLFSVAFKYVF
jgi:Tfp pilus assembly protein PilF